MIRNKTILKAVQDLLGKNNITKADILSITKLDLSGKELLEVSDLAEFRNLENLQLTENCLTDLSPLSDLTTLKELRAGNDPFLSEEQKAARKGKNHFKDHSFLKKLINLDRVEFTDTNINNIDFVYTLPNLLEFWAYRNPIKDVTPLENNKKLLVGYFYDCPIKDIGVCRDLPDLTGIAINCTGVSDLGPLEERTGFTYLDAHDSRVSDLSPIRNMVKMNYLTLAGTRISDITPLLGMQMLQWLTLGENDDLSFENALSVIPQLKGLNTVTFYKTNFNEDQKKIMTERSPHCNVVYDRPGVY